jgi:hypothetical protein
LFAANSSAASIALVRAGLLAIIALGIMEVADLIAVAHDTRGGSEANLWTLTAFQPTVQLSPPSGSYVPGTFQTVSVSAPGIGTQGLTYRWSLAGSSLANLSDGTNVGASFTSNSNVVTLGTTPSTQGDLTLSVTVLKNGVEVGTVNGVFALAVGQPEQYFEISFGPRYQYPNGGGYWIAYHEILLDDTKRTVVKMRSKNNGPGFNGAVATMTVSLPPKSTPVYPTTQEIVAAQNVDVPKLRSDGYVTDYSYTETFWAPSQAFRLVSYGDRVLVWVGRGGWTVGSTGTISNSADAKKVMLDALALEERSIVIQP